MSLDSIMALWHRVLKIGAVPASLFVTEDFALGETRKVFEDVAWASEPITRLETNLAGMREVILEGMSVSIVLLVFSLVGASIFGLIAAIVSHDPTSWAVALGLWLLYVTKTAVEIVTARVRYRYRCIVHAIQGVDLLQKATVATDREGWLNGVSACLSSVAVDFYRTFRPEPTSYAPEKKHIRAHRRRLAALGSLFFTESAHAVLSHPDQIGEVRDDVARAVLRMDAGEWGAVAKLRKFGEDVPSVPLSRMTRIAFVLSKPIAVAILAFLTALAGMIVTLARLLQ